MLRIIFSLLALVALTAFAPAPFPKSSRGVADTDQITVATFQGTWRVASMVRYHADGSAPHKWAVTHVRVKDDRWTFLHNENASNGYVITIDNTRHPAALDFHPDGMGKGKGGSTGKGIIRRKGDAVEIVYLFGGPPRPESFDRPPAGYYRLTLLRQR